MDCEFYDHLSPPRGAKRLLVPIQRVTRRALRPMFHRLRDLLRLLFDRQADADARIAALTMRVAELEAKIGGQPNHKEAGLPKAFVLDYTAVTRRLAMLEDHVLAMMAERATAAEPPATLPARKAS